MHKPVQYKPEMTQDTPSLRDQFAMNAMPLVFGHMRDALKEEGFELLDEYTLEPTWEINWVARYAYVLADAMLRARKTTDWAD